MLRLILCDWNGTIFRDTLEETFFFGLCRRAMLGAIARADVRKVARLLAAGRRCWREYRLARRRPDDVPLHIARIVEMLNADVFRGLTRADLASYARSYARQIQPRIDRRLLGPLRAASDARAVPIGVVSAGCRQGIEAALAAAGAPFDFVVANDFRWNGDVTAGFEFTISDNKRKVLEWVLETHGVGADEVMDVGDSPQDEQCFRMVGVPVVSFYAAAAHRRRFARDCGALVPADQEAFEDILRRAMD